MIFITRNTATYLLRREKLNYDHPNAFDTDLMIKHIKELTRWRPVERPVYDFTIHNRVDETMIANGHNSKGILIFENKELLIVSRNTDI